MWFNWVWLTTTNSNVELESWLEHKAYVTSPFPLVRRAQTEIENMSHVKQMACSYWIPSLILDADWVFRTLIVEKPYQTQCITPSRYFICLMFGRGGTFVPYVLIFRLCRSVMKVTKTLWKPNTSKEWYAVERQRTAAPLSERMPTMCGCAQAFGAGMCWKVGSVWNPPPPCRPRHSFPRCYWERKTTKPRNRDGQKAWGCRWETPSSLIRKPLSRHEVTHRCCQDM